MDALNAVGKPALHLALRRGYEKMSHVLIESGASPFIVEPDGKEAIYYCNHNASLMGLVEKTRQKISAENQANELQENTAAPPAPRPRAPRL